MAGVSTPGESSDNPVPINVTAMVDIIFCLCIFFMCSFHFRQLEGKMESWLPKDKGVNTTPVKNVMLEEVRIFLKFNKNASSAEAAVSRQVGSQKVNNDEELRTTLRAMVGNFAKSGLSEVPVIVDSDPLVPWREVVNVLSLCRLEKLERLEFAAPHA
jgi:biopolymer transport protein ExbD